MDQLWTIIFIAALVAAFAVASWHDREAGKRKERRETALGEGSRDGVSFHAVRVTAGGEEEAAEGGEESGVREDERQAAHTRG